MQSIDERVTILLTLKDRVEYTWRWMRHADLTRCPFAVAIADGGSDMSVARVLQNEQSYPHVRYDYRRYPYDESLADYFVKVCDALDAIRSPYVVIADNDDFIMEEGLRESAAFLDSHLDYSAHGSPPIYFRVDGDAGRPQNDSGLWGRPVGFHNPYSSHPFVSESALERVRACLTPYSISWYHLHRRACLREMFGTLARLNASDIILWERVASCLVAASGKVGLGHLPYYFRQTNTPSTCDLFISEKGGFLNRMFDPAWSREFWSLAEALAAVVSERDGVEKCTVLEAVGDLLKREVGKIVLWEISSMGQGDDTKSRASLIQQCRRTCRRILAGLRGGRKIAREATLVDARSLCCLRNALSAAAVGLPE